MASQNTTPSPSPSLSRAAQMIREVFESCRPLTYIRSTEEQRVSSALDEVAAVLPCSSPVPVWTWSITEGLRQADRAAEAGTEAPRAALDFIAAHREPAIFHLKDFHEPLRESSEIRRRLRDVHQSCLDRQKFVVITGAAEFLPEEIERSVIFLELRPPDSVELSAFLTSELLTQSVTAIYTTAGDKKTNALRI